MPHTNTLTLTLTGPAIRESDPRKGALNAYGAGCGAVPSAEGLPMETLISKPFGTHYPPCFPRALRG